MTAPPHRDHDVAAQLQRLPETRRQGLATAFDLVPRRGKRVGYRRQPHERVLVHDPQLLALPAQLLTAHQLLELEKQVEVAVLPHLMVFRDDGPGENIAPARGPI